MLVKVQALVASHLENWLEKKYLQNETHKELISIKYKELLDSDKERQTAQEKNSQSINSS